MKNRHLPQMIIYDVNPSFDLLVGENNSKYLGWLRSEYENDAVKKIFENIDPNEKYKMQSMMYRYNSKFLQNMIDYVHPIFQISPNGYLPLRGEMDEMKLKNCKDCEEYAYDAQKISYLESFINDVKDRGIRLVFVASPVWYGRNDNQFKPLTELSHKHSVPFYNFSNDSSWVDHNEMFKDGTHLNAYGADVFTKQLCRGFIHD